MKQETLHQNMNEQLLYCHEKSQAIDDEDETSSMSNETPTSEYGSTLFPNTPMSHEFRAKMLKKRSTRSRILGVDRKGHQRIPSLMGNKSWNQKDKNNIFRVMKRHLKKTKTKKRSGMKLGRVINDSETEEETEEEKKNEIQSDEETVSSNNKLRPRSGSRLDVLSYSTDIIIPSNHLLLPSTSPRMVKSLSARKYFESTEDEGVDDEGSDDDDDDDNDDTEIETSYEEEDGFNYVDDMIEMDESEDLGSKTTDCESSTDVDMTVDQPSLDTAGCRYGGEY